MAGGRRSGDRRTMNPANEVNLAGRISAPAEQRQLPSGDTVVSFRVVVPRTKAAQRRTRQRVDTVECSVWASRLRRSALALRPGDEVMVHGELRRTFRRSAQGVTSWVTVDVSDVRRMPTEATTS
jgi:single-strand DNA-binding protein